MQINKNKIDNNSPAYFIAEIGANFDRDLERAKSLIWLSKECGANAAKFQHFSADTLVSDHEFKRLKNKTHQLAWKKSVYETYRDAELNIKWTSILAEEAKKAGIDFFTSPYAYHLADEVDAYVPAYKIGSGDITWIDFLQHVAAKGKPVILATGASNMDEVEIAVQAIHEVTNELVLMQCNTNYTGSLENHNYTNLNVLRSYAEKFPTVILGLSDHTGSHVSVLGAIALGAKVIEKHFTDDSSRNGPDHPFSTSPESWREMIKLARELEGMMGDGNKKVEVNEYDARIVQRRAICANRRLVTGHILSEDDFDYLRPCVEGGYVPYEKNLVIGKRLINGLEKGESILKSNVGAEK